MAMLHWRFINIPKRFQTQCRTMAMKGFYYDIRYTTITIKL